MGLIKEGEWGTCFRTVISPDPLVEDATRDLDLRLLTEDTMQALQRRLKDRPFAYFAAIHTDHSNNRHIQALRDAATENAREQRRLLDKTQEQTQGLEQRHPTPQAGFIFRSQSRSMQTWMQPASDWSGGAPQQNPTCSSCGFTQEMQRLTKTLFHCTSCGRIVAIRGLGLEVVREPALALSQELEVGSV